jgi:hypothetical protein
MKCENFCVDRNTRFPRNQSRCGEETHEWTDTITLQLINFYKGHKKDLIFTAITFYTENSGLL